MKRGLQTGFALLQFLGSLLTEWMEKKPLRIFYKGGKTLGKTKAWSFEVLHQAPWWVKAFISLLGLGGLTWIYF